MQFEIDYDNCYLYDVEIFLCIFSPPTPTPFVGSRDVYVVCLDLYVALTAVIYFCKI